MSRIFSDKIGLMTEANELTEVAGKPVWGGMTVFRSLCEERHNLALASIVEATAKPGLTHNNSVVDEFPLVASPHLDSWVINPAFGVGVEQGVEDLQALDTLLAKAPIIEHLGTAAIVWVW